MTFYVYHPYEGKFLAKDEKKLTSDYFSAACFSSRAVAEDTAVRILGETHRAVVLDDGFDV